MNVLLGVTPSILKRLCVSKRCGILTGEAGMSGYYRIVEAQLPLVGGLGGHNLIAVLNPSGQVIQE